MLNERTHGQRPLALLGAVERAKKEAPLVWVQHSALIAAEEWYEQGCPQLLYNDTLTGLPYINPKEAWRLAEVIGKHYTAEQLLKKRFPALNDILNAEAHQPKDWAGMFTAEQLAAVEAEDCGLSMLDNFTPDYEWHSENAGLSREEVDELWRFMSVQLYQSMARSVTGGNAKGMFVLISDGGQGKSTFVEAIAQAMQEYVFTALKAEGLTIPEGTSILATDNMAGTTPDEWSLTGYFLNSVCCYFTEKAHYLTDNKTLDLFKGITAGTELEFRLMHSQRTKRGRQRATAFLDFNPSMVNTLLSGKLGEDVATARRFMPFYIKAANPNAWTPDSSHPAGGFLKITQDEEAKARLWRHIKYCSDRKDIVHGVISPSVAQSFEKLIKALSARSATSQASFVRSCLQEETRFLINRNALLEHGIKPELLTRIGAGALKDLLLIPKDRDERLRITVGGERLKLMQTDWVVLKDGWDWPKCTKAIKALWESRGPTAPTDKESKRSWLLGLQWTELELGGWELSSPIYQRPLGKQ